MLTRVSVRLLAVALPLVAAALAFAGTVTYEYDELGRLKTVTDDAGRRTSYSLDPAGNRTSRTSTVDTQAPSAPGSLGATAFDHQQINLSWTASTDNFSVTRYEIYRNGSSTPLVSVNAPATSYSDTGLTPSTLYSYTAKAFDGAGNPSPSSNTASATTAPPPPPGSLQFSATNFPTVENNGTVTITATRTGGSAGAAAVNYATSNGSATAGSDYTTKTGTLNWSAGDAANKTFTVSLLNDSVFEGSETFTVTLSGASGASLGSPSSATVTIADDELPDTTPPSVPNGLAVSSSSSAHVSLTWNASTDTGGSGLAGYKIWRDGNQIGTSTTTSFTDNGVSGTTTYSYRVSAYDNATPPNNSNQSAALPVTTPDTIPPSAPTGLNANAVSSTQVNLSWNAATDTGGSGLAGYKIFRNGGQIGTSPTTSYSDTTTSGTTSYTYQVAAYDNATLTSGMSNTASVTTPDTIPPSAPTGLGANAVSSTQVNLSWNASTDTGGSGLVGYKIFRNGGQIGTSPTTSYSDTTTSGTTSYTYQVAAYDNATLTSGMSNTASVTTPDTIPPSAPSLSANVIAYNRVDLSWTASTDSGGSGMNFYWIYRNGSYLWDTSVAGLGVLSYSDTSTAQNTTYNYTVIAQDHAGNQTTSNVATVTTPSAPAQPAPGAPGWTNGWAACVSPVGCQDLYSNFTLTWAVTTGGTPDRYELQRSTNAGSSWALAHTGTLTNPFLNLSIPVNQVHWFRVRGCNVQAGCGPYSTNIILWHNPNP